MKKKFIIGSLGCIVAGLLIFLISMAFLGFDFEKLSITPGESEEKNVTLDSLNKNIMIHEQNADISIGISTDDMIHIHYTDYEREYYEIEDGEDLRIWKEDDYKWYDQFLSCSLSNSELEILLPEDYQGNLKIDGSNGNISITDYAADELDIRTTNGIIAIDNSTSDETSIRTTNGEITIVDSSLGKTFVQSTNGEIDICNSSFDNTSIHTTNGSIDADTCSFQDYTAENTNGDLILHDITANTILLTTTNGKISGNILGDEADYNLTSSTTNGNTNLIDKDLMANTKSLAATTTNGDITITFEY